MTGIQTIQYQTIKIDQGTAMTLPEKGTILTGEVLEKQKGQSKILLENQVIRMDGTVPIAENPGEEVHFQVVKGQKNQLILKYLPPTVSGGSINRDQQTHQGTAVQRDYKQVLATVLKPFSESDRQSLETMRQEGAKALQSLSETMTDSDLKQMFKDGLNPEKVSVELLAQAVKNNKSAIRQGDLQSVEVSYEKALGQLEKSYEMTPRLEEIAETLREVDYPINKKHVDRLLKGLDVLDDVKGSDFEGRLKLLALNDAQGTPSLEQVYGQLKGPAIPITNSDLAQATLETLVTRYLSKEGLPPTEENIAAAKAMLIRDIPLSVSGIEFLTKPETVYEQIEEKAMTKAMVSAIVNDQQPLSVLVEALNLGAVTENKAVEEAELAEGRPLELARLMEDLYKIEDGHIAKAITEGKDTSLEELVAYKDIDVNTWDQGSKQSLSFVQRRLQVEEIRLKMTLEAAVRMEKTGLKIDTAPIEKVVESLREQETRMVEAKVKAYGQNEKPIDLQVAKEVMESLTHAKAQHEDTVANLLKSETPVTLDHVVDVSSELKGLKTLVNGGPFIKAYDALLESSLQTLDENQSVGIGNQALVDVTDHVPTVQNNPYESTMTEVRPDLGDRIESTFNQIDSMLESLDMPVTEVNRKAVEILARNTMDITAENITEIQLVQEKIDFALNKMTPLAVVRVIEAGINPMELHIDELNSFIQSLKDTTGESQGEKISQMIQSLDQSGQLSDDQRKGLMSVYRTFDTVMRSKGAATGFLVKRDMPLTVNALFEAAKYIRKAPGLKSSVQAEVGDGFGPLEKANNLDQTLRNQVSQSVENLSSTTVQKTEGGQVQLTPVQVLQKALMDIRVVNFVDALSEAGAKDLLLGEDAVVNKEMPLEALTKLMDEWQAPTLQNTEKAEAYLKMVESEPGLLSAMVSSKIPLTLGNFKQAMAMNNDTFLLMGQLETMVKAIESPELKADVLEILKEATEDVVQGKVPYERLSEALERVEGMLKDSTEEMSPNAYRSIEGAAKTVAHTQMIQITEEYYQIPVMMDGQIHQLNMMIFNDGESSRADKDEMKVLMSFDTNNLGKIQAQLSIRGNLVQMNIQSKDQEVTPLLKEFEGAFEEVIRQTNFTLEGISYNKTSMREPIEVVGPEAPQGKVNKSVDGHIDWSV